jgi:hypothetical protein
MPPTASPIPLAKLCAPNCQPHAPVNIVGPYWQPPTPAITVFPLLPAPHTPVKMMCPPPFCHPHTPVKITYVTSTASPIPLTHYVLYCQPHSTPETLCAPAASPIPLSTFCAPTANSIPHGITVCPCCWLHASVNTMCPFCRPLRQSTLQNVPLLPAPYPWQELGGPCGQLNWPIYPYLSPVMCSPAYIWVMQVNRVQSIDYPILLEN